MWRQVILIFHLLINEYYGRRREDGRTYRIETNRNFLELRTEPRTSQVKSVLQVYHFRCKGCMSSVTSSLLIREVVIQILNSPAELTYKS